MEDLPADFELYAQPSPYLERVGPLYQKTGENGLVYGPSTASQYADPQCRWPVYISFC